MRTPSDEELEEDVLEHLESIQNLDADALRQGYEALLRMNGLLRRQLCESISMARVVYVGRQSRFDVESRKIS